MFFNGKVKSIAKLGNSRTILVGEFTTYKNEIVNRIACLNLANELSSVFDTGNGFDNIANVAVYDGSKILVGGRFLNYNGITRRGLVRLNNDGSIDTSFNIGIGFRGTVADSQAGYVASINAIAIQNDGKILVGGDFAVIHEVFTNGIVRLNPDGSYDSSFNTNLGFSGGPVNAIAIQNDGKILVGGDFTNYSGGVIKNRIIRLNTNGSLDNTFGNNQFDDGFNNSVNTIFVSDSKIFVGGAFTTYRNSACSNIICLESNGNINTNFNIGNGFSKVGGGSSVNDITSLDSNSIVVGGDFTSYKNTPANRIINLNTNNGDVSLNPPCDNTVTNPDLECIFQIAPETNTEDFNFEQEIFPGKRIAIVSLEPLNANSIEVTQSLSSALIAVSKPHQNKVLIYKIKTNNLISPGTTGQTFYKNASSYSVEKSWEINGIPNSLFGISINFDYEGKRLVIGSAVLGASGPELIYVRTFKYNEETDQWAQFAQTFNFDLPPDLAYAGVSVAMTAYSLIIGLPNLSQVKVYYAHNGDTDTWELYNTYVSPFTYGQDSAYGWSVDIAPSLPPIFQEQSTGKDCLDESGNYNISNTTLVEIDKLPIEPRQINFVISDPSNEGFVHSFTSNFYKTSFKDGEFRAASYSTSEGCHGIVLYNPYLKNPFLPLDFHVLPQNISQTNIFTCLSDLNSSPISKSSAEITLTFESDPNIFPTCDDLKTALLTVPEVIKFSGVYKENAGFGYLYINERGERLYVSRAGSLANLDETTNDNLWKIAVLNTSKSIQSPGYWRYIFWYSLQDVSSPTQVTQWIRNPYVVDLGFFTEGDGFDELHPSIKPQIFDGSCLLKFVDIDELPDPYNRLNDADPEKFSIKMLFNIDDSFGTEKVNIGIAQYPGNFGNRTDIFNYYLTNRYLTPLTSLIPTYPLLSNVPLFNLSKNSLLTNKIILTSLNCEEVGITDTRLWVDITVQNASRLGFTGVDDSVAAMKMTPNWPSDNSYKTELEKNGGIRKYINTFDYIIIPISKPWVALAMSEDGKYQTAIAYNENIYYSHDFGSTWTEVLNSGQRDWTGIDISLDGQFQTAVAKNGGLESSGIFISSDYGKTWAPAISGTINWSSIALNGKGDIQLATLKNLYVFISYDYGVSWSTYLDTLQEGIPAAGQPILGYCGYDYNFLIGRSWSGAALSKSKQKKYNYFITSVNKFGRGQASLDTGKNFNMIFISSEYLFDEKISKIASSYNAVFQTVVMENGNIYISRNYGRSWSQVTNSNVFNNKNWKDICINSNGKYQTAVAFNDSIYTSNDYGKTWTSFNLIKPWKAVASNGNGNIQFAITTNEKIYKKNSDNTWSQSVSPALNQNIDWRDISISENGDKITIVAYNNNIYISNNEGESFFNPINSIPFQTWIAVDMSLDGQFQTAITDNGLIFRSFDSGLNWFSVDHSLNLTNATNISINDDGKIQIISANNTLYISYDYGVSWENLVNADNVNNICIAKNKFNGEFIDYGDTGRDFEITEGWRENSNYGHYVKLINGGSERVVGIPNLQIDEINVGKVRFEQYMLIDKVWKRSIEDLQGSMLDDNLGEVFDVSPLIYNKNFVRPVTDISISRTFMALSYNNNTSPKISFGPVNSFFTDDNDGKLNIFNQKAQSIGINYLGNIIALIDGNNFKIYGNTCFNMLDNIIGCCVTMAGIARCFICYDTGELIGDPGESPFNLRVTTAKECYKDRDFLNFYPHGPSRRTCVDCEMLGFPVNYNSCSWGNYITCPWDNTASLSMSSIDLNQNTEVLNEILNSINEDN